MRDDIIHMLNASLKMYRTGLFKPDRESALQMYAWFYEAKIPVEKLEMEIRKTVKNEVAVKLFVVKEVLDKMSKAQKLFK